MWSLDLADHLRCSSIDVNVTDALIFDLPVELGVELMSVIGSDLSDADREFIDNVISEVDRVCLFRTDGFSRRASL